MKRVFDLKLIFALIFYSLITLKYSYGQSDTLILTYREYIENITNYHPIAKKADLRLKLSLAETMGAKGNLDPQLSSGWNQKNLDDKLYYRQTQAKIKIPTPMGIDFVGGYENTEGVFVNPENSTNNLGLWHLGIEVNILQGLVVNERKTAIEQARVFQDLAINEQNIILNDLIYNASLAYLIWQQYSYNKNVLAENISISNTYFENTKLSFSNGEKTAMDTLEAFILYQDALALMQKNESGLTKSIQHIENYLWFNDLPVTLQENVIPEYYENDNFPNPIEFENSTIVNHPIILASINKLSHYEIEQRLKREKLKPKLRLNYNPLLATSANNIIPNYSINDHKFGFDFSMPLLLRSEKADILRGDIKIQETELDIQDKTNELHNKIENSWQQHQLLQEQLTLMNLNVENYRRLLDGEQEKYNFGESSVFLLNKRQEKYIEGRLKLIEIHIKQQIELLNFLYYSNQLIRE